jgi:L,D-peptidoglycan transpeptidase YkuD (ErfK/YbiS/YcfS/YnhG family)
MATTRGAGQLVTVEAPTSATINATVELWQRQGSCWVDAGGPWAGFIGANGFSDHKREGDNTTPIGIFSISPITYGNEPNPGVRGTYHQLVCGDWWDEDPTSPAYNTFQHVACGTKPPFGGGSESLWTETAAYPSFAVVNYNVHPIVPYAGSAIFVHANIGGPTAGCVSIPLPYLDQMLRWLDPAEEPMIAMGPASVLSQY